jgi:hypothetical protein
MKSYCTILSIVLLLLTNGVTAQVGAVNKSKRKSSKAFISIANQDLKGASMSIQSVRQLEKTYNSIGDKTLVEDMILKSLLFVPGKDAVKYNDTAYLKSINDCPQISLVRGADPYLVCFSIALHRVSQSKLSFGEAYSEFRQWHNSNLPNAPGVGGNNEMPNGTVGNDAINWVLRNTEAWVKSYPGEYKFALTYYAENYKQWEDTVKLVTPNHHNYFKSLLGKFDFINPEEYSIYFEKNMLVQANAAVLNAKLMQDNPRQFVAEVYEAILLRPPTEEEMSGILEILKNDKTITPEMFYYAIMSSNEYKYY